MKIQISFLIILFLFSACNSTEEGEKPKVIPPKIGENSAVAVRVISPEKVDYRDKIHASGSFTSDNETFLGFKIGGVVQEVYVEKGDKVRKGQLLARLNLTEIQAQVSTAQTALEKAKRDAERIGRLFADSVVTLEQKQNTETGLEVAQSQLKIAKFNAAFAEIRAPESGYVLEKLANAGQVVAPGTPVLQVGGHGSASGKWLLTVGVSDVAWAALQEGDSATIEAAAWQGKHFRAKVSRKARAINPRSGTFDIDIELLDTPSEIATGMFAEVDMFPRKTQALWKIPYEALLDGDNNSAFVFVSRDKENVSMKKVSVSKLLENYALISDGLNSQDFVVSSGSAYLKEGSKIKVSE